MVRKLTISLCLVLALCGQAWATAYVALTFDDGPTGKYTARLLDILAQQQVKATFFLCDYRVEQYPALAARMAEEGHEIGLHGQCHAFFTQLSPQELSSQLTQEALRIGEITGQETFLLRPPGGLMPKQLLEDYAVVLWSVDPKDWATHSASQVAHRVVGQAKPGDIILLHDASQSSVEAAEQIITQLKAKGFGFATVSELAQRYGTELKGGEIYSRFRA